jgi:hypothetical protein
MQTIIHDNGSRWNGDAPAAIAELLEILARTPLDPVFEEYGNFIDTDPQKAVYLGQDRYENTGPIYPDMPGAVQFWGNFAELSHVFRIGTNDPAVIETLTAAIRANQATAAYAEAKAQHLARKAMMRERQAKRVAEARADALRRAAEYLER